MPVPNTGVQLKTAGNYNSLPVLASTVSAADGTFTIQNPPAGSLTIYALAPSSAYWAWAGYPVTIVSGQQTNAGDLPISQIMQLSSPENEATVGTATPTLMWAAFPGSSSYRVTAYNNATGQTVFSQSTQSTQMTVSPALQTGQEYQWAVFAYNASGTEIAYYSVWYFTVSTNSPALSIGETHVGNFTQGQTGATYTVAVSNAASAGPTSGTVTVQETAPPGLSLLSMAGTGWACAAGACTRSDVLAAGASYPAITVTVDVATNAASPQVNSVTVSGGGSGSASATDTTTIVRTASPMPSVASFSVAAVASAANQYTADLTLTDAPPATLSGTLCLTFSANSSVVNGGAYRSQEVVFANGTTGAACSSTLNTTLAFTVPAGSATVLWSGNSSQFSEGTVAGTVTVTLNALADPSGNSVLPSPAPTQTITVPAGAPALTDSPALTTTSTSVTVVFDGIAPTRSVTGATYVFNPGSSQATTVSAPFTSGPFAGDDQSQWFGTTASLATGGSFSLALTFPCTNCSAVTGVQVTLTN